MSKQNTSKNTITCNNLPELYLAVSQFISDYYEDEEYDPFFEECSASVREVFPQMRDERIHTAVTILQLNAGLRPDDPEYVRCCPQCLEDCIHEAESAFVE